MPYGLFGILVLALDIYAIYLIVTTSGDPMKKLVWVLLILLLPLLGVILYFLLGRNGRVA